MPKNIQAFPSDPFYVGDKRFSSESGMTLRDYFAAQAMQGILANHYGGFSANEGCAAKVAELAFQQADAMLAAREVQP